jgi:hypothetical protein
MAKKRKKSKSAQNAAASATEEPKAKDEKTIAAPKKDAKERRKARADGIVMTLYPAVLGVIFGFASLLLFGTGSPEAAMGMVSSNLTDNVTGNLTGALEGSAGMTYPWYFVMTLVIAVSFYIQKFTYPYLKINVEEFQTKDWFYVEFIAVDLWLVTWTLLLN